MHIIDKMLEQLKNCAKRSLIRSLATVQEWQVLISPDAGALVGTGGFDALLRAIEGLEGEPLAKLMRAAGASIGEHHRMNRGLCIHNAYGTLAGLSIGNHVHIGRQVFLDIADRIAIGDRVTVSMRVIVLTHTDTGDAKGVAATHAAERAAVNIENDVYIGAGAIILPGVRLGAGAMIGAGAVVTRDVAAGQLVAGVPARDLHGARPSR